VLSQLEDIQKTKGEKREGKKVALGKTELERKEDPPLRGEGVQLRRREVTKREARKYASCCRLIRDELGKLAQGRRGRNLGGKTREGEGILSFAS